MRRHQVDTDTGWLVLGCFRRISNGTKVKLKGRSLNQCVGAGCRLAAERRTGAA
jgi:hypothetical protein